MFLPTPGHHKGFTSIELMVVIAMTTILAAMLLPAIGRAKLNAKAIVCMNNTRQLTLAWRMYAEHNRDTLPFSYAVGTNAPSVWVRGTLDNSNPTANDNWNYETTIKKGVTRPATIVALADLRLPMATRKSTNGTTGAPCLLCKRDFL